MHQVFFTFKLDEVAYPSLYVTHSVHVYDSIIPLVTQATFKPEFNIISDYRLHLQDFGGYKISAVATVTSPRYQ